MPDDMTVSLIPAGAVAGRARRPVNKRSPTDKDAEVGRRIRDFRIAIGMPLSELSTLIGVSQPQLYRYESGITRVAASRLIAIAAALGVSVEALTRLEEPGGPGRSGSGAEADLLLRAFSSIARAERRSALIALARSMAEAEAEASPNA